VKVAWELARHSTPTLTIGRYAHARLHDLSAALEAVPGPTDPQANPPETYCPHNCPQSSRETPHLAASCRDDDSDAPKGALVASPVFKDRFSQGLRGFVRGDATRRENAPKMPMGGLEPPTSGL